MFQSTHPEDEDITFLRKARKFLPDYPVSHPRRLSPSQSPQQLKFYCNFLISSLPSISIPFDHIVLQLTHNFLPLVLSFLLHILLLFSHFPLYIQLRFLDFLGCHSPRFINQHRHDYQFTVWQYRSICTRTIPKSTSDWLVKKIQNREQNFIIWNSYTHNCITSPHSCHPH
jgi:hypothetical protein